MNIFDILKNLFTNPKSSWIHELDDKDISPVVIQRFLSLSNRSRDKARILNKFVYTLPPKMYLAAAWSLLYFDGKKLNKAPFIKYPKKSKNGKEKYGFIYDKLKRQFELSDHDFDINKRFIDLAIEADKFEWFGYYGAKNEDWHTNSMDVTMLREYGNRPKVEKKSGLDAFM